MKPFHPALWSGFLFVCVLQWKSEANDADLCEEEFMHELIVTGSSKQKSSLNKHDVFETFSCQLYPTNMLNCSWSFLTIQKEAQLSVQIGTCEEEEEAIIYFRSNSSKQKEGSWSQFFHEHFLEDIVIQFNMSLPSNWTGYTYIFDKDVLEVLSPPANISTSVKDGALLVTWDLPVSRNNVRPHCFQYELDLGDQDEVKNLTNKLSYTELNDPTHTYKVRIRAKKTEDCLGGPEWSEWSHTVTVEPSVDTLKMLVIVSISLGIPMILLAVLLLFRHQRVSQLLFPPIPRPPPKYIHFLEKSETPNLFYPAQTSKTEEEITEVEDTEES